MRSCAESARSKELGLWGSRRHELLWGLAFLLLCKIDPKNLIHLVAVFGPGGEGLPIPCTSRVACDPCPRSVFVQLLPWVRVTRTVLTLACMPLAVG